MTGQPDIVPLAADRIDGASGALALAFQDDPLHAYVLPDPEERAERSPAHFAILLRFGHLFGEVFTTRGDPVGAAIWQPPGADVTPERAAESGFDKLAEVIGQEALVRLGRVFDFLETHAAREMPTTHWYVMAVGVAPASQSRGIGTALLRPGIERAGAAGLPCYLATANSKNVAFYLALGFRLMVETIEPSSGLTFWTFRRDPS